MKPKKTHEKPPLKSSIIISLQILNAFRGGKKGLYGKGAGVPLRTGKIISWDYFLTPFIKLI